MTANPKSELRVLAIGAHPDDIELACAGTLARCAQRGDRVTIAILCRGDAASSDLPASKLVAVRRQEARAAARLLGAKMVQAGLKDGGVELSRAHRSLVADVIRQAAPDVIITHFHSDYGSDHNNTLTLTVDATLSATLKNAAARYPPLRRMPLLYMMEPLGGFGFQPEVYVDITTAMPLKTRMLECHRSQIDWMSRYGSMDLRRYIEVVGRFRGYQAGVEFAEGFIVHKSWGHVPAHPVLP